jgi:hypothetical protein
MAAKALALEGTQYGFAVVFVVFGVASAAGALTYWLLAKLLVLPHLRFRALYAAAFFCTSATLIVVALHENLPQLRDDLWLTLAWWVAFSASLFVTEEKHGS